MTVGHPRPGVLRLITRLNVGGPARHALLLTRGLAPYVHTTLAAGTPEADEGELSDASVTVHPLPLVRPPHPVADARSLGAIRRLLVETRPALVHTHMAKAGALGRLAATTVRPRPRTVHTFHGHVLEGYFGPLARQAFIRAERRLARSTDVLVTVSPEIRDELVDLGIGRPGQYHVIRLGLELGPFLAVNGQSGRLRAHLGLSSTAPLVGIIGRLVPIKDHLTLFAAIRRLPGVHVAIIGDGQLRPQLEARVQALGLGDRVHFTGWWSDVPAAVSDLDAVALTSRNEGTPVALIEAAAAGRPVVATDVGGVRSVVEDGVSGLLAPAGDEERVSALLGRLLADPSLRQRMGQAGRQLVRERFLEDRLLRDMRALYSDLLKVEL